MTNRFATIVFDGLILSLVLWIFPVYAWATTPVSCQGLIRVTPSLLGTASSCGPPAKGRTFVFLNPVGPLATGASTFRNYTPGGVIPSGMTLNELSNDRGTAVFDSDNGYVVIAIVWTGSTSDVSYATFVFVPGAEQWILLDIDNKSGLTLKQLQSKTEDAQILTHAIDLLNTLGLASDFSSAGGGGGGAAGSGNGGINVPDPGDPVVAISYCGYIGKVFQGCVIVPIRS